MFEIESISSILLILWLGICSLQDIKKKSISIYYIIGGFILLFIVSISLEQVSIVSRIAGGGIGLLLLALNPLTKGQIGIGDGIIIGVIGICFGFTSNVSILLVALFFSAFISIILLVFKKVNRKQTIPFVPFLLLGYLGVTFF